MSKYFHETTDIFVDAFFGDGTLFVQTWLSGEVYSLDDTNFWDKQRFKTIKDTHVLVAGKGMNYWISGNVQDQWRGDTRQDRARNFAIWYHANKHRFTTYDLNT